VKCEYVARVRPCPYGSIASRFALEVSALSVNCGRYSSAEVVNELIRTSAGRAWSYGRAKSKPTEEPPRCEMDAVLIPS
jgi:hypothetical protein